MFTGIIEEIGTISAINKTQNGTYLKVKTEKVYQDVAIGDSVSINGACLSVVDIKDNVLGFDVMGETLKHTTLGGLKVGESVNLESSLKAGSKIGGHFVFGHIDYRGRIIQIEKKKDDVGFRVSIPEEFSDFVVLKGSVALDGVSLTVAELTKDSFTVYLIPHTLDVTTLSKKKTGDFLNVELDVIAKYISKQSRHKSDMELLLKKYEYL